MPSRPPTFLFVTGTDTGVGKTVFTAALTRHLRAADRSVVALKPLCSGSREDAVQLHEAAGKVLSLNQVNPWYFRPALAPVLGAQAAGLRLRRQQVISHLKRVATGFDLCLIEGAGGLLSPMGEDFDSRDLMSGLRAVPLVVTPNTLGAVGRLRLVLEALPPAAARSAQCILVQPPKPDSASRSNPTLLGQFVPADRVHLFPRLRRNPTAIAPLQPSLDQLLKNLHVRSG